MLREIDPVSFYFLEESLPKNCLEEDDGSASFLLYAGANLLHILEKPIRVQTLLRNIFEMTFDKMERATQGERFEKLRRVYPDIAEACDPTRRTAFQKVVGHLWFFRCLTCGFWN